MAFNNWKKVENDTGYPFYIDDATGKQQNDHPAFCKIMESMEKYNGIKYSAYRIAYKVFELQKQFRVPPLRISSGVFARHQLSLSENSLSLDTAELESVLADIYFAAEKEGLFSGDVDLAVDLMINLLLNVYDKERKEPIRVLAAKTLLILLSDESIVEKWLALANCCADHNGCVSPRRLSALLVHVAALPEYLGSSCEQVQHDVDACFNKSAGMLGMSGQAVCEWGMQQCLSARWLTVVQRIMDSRKSNGCGDTCSACGLTLTQVLRFKCSKCTEVYFCEVCYLYDKDLSHVSGHKKTHIVHEIISGETKPSECMSFIKGMKRFFFCTKTKKKKTSKKCSKRPPAKVENGTLRRKNGKPVIFTSTVGKASGNVANNPTTMLQDIITQLETQNKALQELSSQLETASKQSTDGQLKEKVDAHSNQISTQISRLKVLKDNLCSNNQENESDQKCTKAERIQAFDLFSPILVEDKQSKVTESNQPRVLSLDSGNFSVVSKHDSQNLMTMSGDALKPIVVHATSDSISAVSMNDISQWYNETVPPKTEEESLRATEQQFAADVVVVANSNQRVREASADLDCVLDRLQQILTHNFTVDESCFDNTQLRETATEMEGLLGSLIRGVEQRATLTATTGAV